MKGLRIPGALLVGVVAAWASHALVWLPLRCHLLKAQLTAPSYAAFSEGTQRARDFARANLARVEPCLNPVCRDVELLFLLAINQRTLGNHEAALALYRDALRYDRRPEIFVNLADTQLALGDRRGAFENYVRAGIFFPGYLQLIDDPQLRREVRAGILRRRPDLAHTIDGAIRHAERLRRRM